MSKIVQFMKQNKKTRENTTFPATKSLCGEDGNALAWEIRPLSTRDDERIKEQCTIEVPVKGKPNMFRPKLNTGMYITKMLAASVVYPNLLDAELQDSYGVKNEEDLLKEMIDDPGEFNDFALFVQQFNGFNVSMEDKVEEAKN